MTVDWANYIPELKLITVALVATVVLALIAPLLTHLLTRLTAPFSFAQNLLERIKRPLHFLIPIVGLQVIWRSAPDDFPYVNAISHVITLTIIAGVIWLGLRVVDAGREVILLRHPIDMSDNRSARRIQTQTQVLVQTLYCFVVLFGIAAMLMTFPGARQIGASLLASAGLAGLAVGFAAKPVLGNLIAGLQIAITQPISLDDVVIVENEWGRIEEITGSYVVIKIWDERRLIVPLQYFIENPFQNWTRKNSQLIGSVFLWVDYSMPLEPLRKELEKLCKESTDWDGRVSVLQVTDTNERAIQLRILASSSNASKGWDLRCNLREKLIHFIGVNYPDCLPRLRADLHDEESTTPSSPTAATIPNTTPDKATLLDEPTDKPSQA